MSAAALALVSSSSLLAQVAASGIRPLAEDARAFGSREEVKGLDISPDGTKAVYVAPAKDRWSAVMVVDLAKADSHPIAVSNANPETLRWCRFASDTRLVCRFTANVSVNGVLAGFSRLVAMDLDGKNAKELGQQNSFYDAGLRQDDGSILDWRSGSDGQVLMQRSYVPEEGKIGTRMVRSQQGLGVDLLDTRTLKVTTIEQPATGVDGYMTDGVGHVRLKSMVETRGDSGMLTGRYKYYYRADGSRDWKVLADYVSGDDYQPLAIDAGLNTIYVLKKLDGRMALYRTKLDGSLATELVASNPKVDIDNVIRAGRGQKVIGYTYAESERSAVYFDPEFKALSEALGKTLPNLPMVDFAGSSSDGSQLLLSAGSDNDPGRFYVFKKKSRELNELFASRSVLDGRPLARVKSVSFPAADGTMVPAYLTLPVGKQAADLPAVVLPHGGPSARDEWGFDWLPQFLAARGYAVIQPNYRGSAGFGDAWLMKNGFQSWRTSIGDIDAAARYLVTAKIADPKRLAVVGWSYGGYAALQSAATEPTLYRAVAAIAPVTDLAELKTDAAQYTNAKLVEQFVGTGPHIVDGSPLRHAAAISVPVLLVHGDQDINVAITQSDRMNAALSGAGKKVQYLRYKGLDHQLDDSVVRIEMLTKLGELLDSTIGH
ncbi:S9 family peptidase [Sphingomonas ginkgonis]|uniref:S9 family peptidase n=1 Tax=Sphingomonas ginkgonis TaxID=2315330 RepID=A0A3S0ELU3_9SPHN|nr:alpha/beta fold hydrolase [Sphingomonas ginkgonis]RST30523.1 S9 family peptidase [Sphingomonas ginkgonis]